MAFVSWRTLMVSTVAVVALSAAASAQNGVYLLQLGSFETKHAANERWSSLQGKYPQLLDGLSVRLMDVTLPPDNFTVYRTQAGALSSRANAQSICDRLTAKGDECYVVETAMFQPGSTAAEAPNPPLTHDPMAAMNAPAAAKKEEPAVAAKAEALADKAAVPAPSAAVASKAASSIAKETVAESAAASLPAVAAPSVADAVPAMPPMAAPEAKVAKQVAGKTEQDDGFWSFIQDLDPFADSPSSAASKPQKPEALTKDVVELEPAPTVRAMESVPAAPPAPLMGDLNATQAPPPPLVQPQPAPEIARAEPSHSPASSPVADAGVGYTVPGFDIISAAPEAASSSAPLPPPPVLPAVAGETYIPGVAQSQAPAMPEAVAAPEVSAPMAPPPVQPVPQAVLAPAPQPVMPPPPVSAGNADVKVAEAVQVPLSQQQVPMAKPTFTPPMSMGTPSQQMPGVKTLWAQVGYFPDQQVALAYWDGFRRANPTFPPVRVRVTSPYVAQSGGEPKAALRVGPFDRASYVNDICDEVRSSNEDAKFKLNCVSVSDLGTSTSQRAERMSGAQARYETVMSQSSALASEMYWVQLGSFATPVDAQGHWQQLSQAHKPLLDSISPNVAAPIMSSAMQPVFRLRVGPYIMRAKADELCAKMRSKGSQCLIVFSK